VSKFLDEITNGGLFFLPRRLIFIPAKAIPDIAAIIVMEQYEAL
jgi:hypothetical protein